MSINAFLSIFAVANPAFPAKTKRDSQAGETPLKATQGLWLGLGERNRQSSLLQNRITNPLKLAVITAFCFKTLFIIKCRSEIFILA